MFPDRDREASPNRSKGVKLKKIPALFLDRDGVVNVEKNYICKIEDFEFIESIFDVCR